MSRPVVLVYHRVTDVDADPLGMVVSPAAFDGHLDVLDAEADVVPLRDIRGAGRRAVAVTFDDGYADNLHVAAPALERHGVPATFFVASRALEGRSFWWDRLHALLASTGELDPDALSVPDCHLHVDIRSAAGRQRALRALTRRLRQLPPPAIDAALAGVEAQIGRPLPENPEPTLDAGGLRALASGLGFEIGAHTISHALLASLEPERQRHEIGESRRQLEEAAGVAVDLFAYPYGMAGSFTAQTEAMVAELGFHLACSNIPGAVSRRGSRWSIPRCAVGDWSPEQFARALDRWRSA